MHGEQRLNTFDNLSLYVQWWKPPVAPKAVILIIHGSFEHGGRYAHLADYFVRLGFAIYAFDLRGHGKSEGERAYINSFGALIKDLEIFINFVAARESETPFFILAHSSGACIALLFAITYSFPAIKGIILSSPALKMKEGVPILARVASGVIASVAPHFRIHKLNSNYLSRNLNVIKSYVDDPLVYNSGIYAGTISEFLKTTDKIRKNLEKVNSPMLILQGTDDKIVDPKGSKDVYALISSKDKTINLYDHCYHELFNEPGNEKIFNDIESWIEKRI